MTERVASIFQNGGNQAVRIPQDMKLPGTQVRLVQNQDGSILIVPQDNLLSYLRGQPPLAREDWPDEVENLATDEVDL
jgi:virulence-associated protein VagC